LTITQAIRFSNAKFTSSLEKDPISSVYIPRRVQKDVLLSSVARVHNTVMAKSISVTSENVL